jgi:hypothetical protein
MSTMNKKLTVLLILALGASHAFAQTTTATASQQSAATSTAQGTIQFSQTPEHTTETVRNVSAPVLGSYAFAASQLSCSSTTQGGFAVAGFSGVFGSSKSQADCVLEVAAAETVRQSTVTDDKDTKAKLQRAAMNIRCQISEEVYQAMQDAGLDCSRKPKDMVSRTDDQPVTTRVASN